MKLRELRTVAVLLAVLLVGSASYQLGAQANVSVSTPITQSKWSFVSSCTYRIFRDATYIYGQSCADNIVTFGGPNNLACGGGSCGTSASQVIQAALTASSYTITGTGGSVFISDGIYPLTTTLTLPVTVTLEGNAIHNGAPQLTYGGANPIIKVMGSGWAIKNIRLVGTYTAGTVGIKVYNTPSAGDSVISGVYVQHFDTGIWILESGDVVLENSYILDNCAPAGCTSSSPKPTSGNGIKIEPHGTISAYSYGSFLQMSNNMLSGNFIDLNSTGSIESVNDHFLSTVEELVLINGYDQVKSPYSALMSHAYFTNDHFEFTAVSYCNVAPLGCTYPAMTLGNTLVVREFSCVNCHMQSTGSDYTVEATAVTRMTFVAPLFINNGGSLAIQPIHFGYVGNYSMTNPYISSAGGKYHYSGIASAGTVVNQTAQFGMTAADAVTCTYRPRTLGLYELSAYVTINTATTDTLDLLAVYHTTDNNVGGSWKTWAFNGQTYGAATPLTTAGTYTYPSVLIQADANYVMLVQTTLPVSSGSISYSVGCSITLESEFG